MHGFTATREDILKLLEQALQQNHPKEVVERLQWFLNYAEHGSISETCRHYRIARSTFYRWLRRFDPNDLSTLTDLPLHKEVVFQRAAPVLCKVQKKPQHTVAKKIPSVQAHTCPFCRLCSWIGPLWKRCGRLTVLLSIFLNLALLFFLLMPGGASASSWAPTLLVNTEAFQVIDDADTASDVYIQFGGTLAKKLTFERTLDRFNFNDDVYIGGDLGVSGTMSGEHLYVSGTGASPIITTTADGDVGIGTTTPDTKLSVAGTISGRSLRVNSTPADNTQGISFGDGDTYIYEAADDVLDIYAGGSHAVQYRAGTVKTKNWRVMNTNDDLTIVGAQAVGQTDPSLAIGNESDLTGTTQPVLSVYGDNLITEKFRIQGDGKVGVGSTSPETEFEVVGTMSGDSLYIQRALSGAGLSDCDGGTSKLLWDATTGQFSCGTDAGSSGTLSQSEADSRYVNVSGDTMTGNLVVANGATLAASGAIRTEGNLTINQDNGAADAILTFGNDAAAETLRFNDTTNGFVFSDDVEVQGTLSGANLAVMAGADSYVMGNVGIGTASPSQKLTVAGNANITGGKLTTDISGTAIDLTNGGGNEVTLAIANATYGMKLGVNSPYVGNAVALLSTGVYPLVFGVNNGEAIRITNGGNVGIGDTTPSNELEVRGTVSGSTLHGHGLITSSGGLVVEGQARVNSGITLSNTEDSQFIRLNDTTNSDSIGIFTGNGSPESVVTAQLGSLYLDHASGKTYKKHTGDGTTTGWTEFATSSGADMAKMTRTSAQSIANNAAVKVYLNSEVFDIGGMATAAAGASGSGRFVIQKAGKYLVTAGWHAAGIGTGEDAYVMIYKNNALVRQSQVRSYAGAAFAYPTITEVLDLAQNDYIEMYVKHNEGAAINTQTSSEKLASMSVVQIDAGGTGGNSSGGSGIEQSDADARYVNVSGDTMTGTLTVNGAATFGSSITLNGVAYTFPTSDGTATGKLLATDGAGNLVWTTDQTGGGSGGGSALIQEGDVSVVTTGSTLDFAAADFNITESPSNEANIALDTDGLYTRLVDMFVNDTGGTMTGALKVTSSISGSSLRIDNGADIWGTLGVSGATVLNANVTLGNASSDVVYTKAQISGSLIPTTTNRFDIGSGALRWNSLYLSGGTLSGGTIHMGSSGDESTIGYDVVGDRIVFDADADGDFDFRFADIGSFDIMDVTADAPTDSGYARIFSRASASGGNDDNTTLLLHAENNLLNDAQGKTNANTFNGSCPYNFSSSVKKFGSYSLYLNCSGYQVYRYGAVNTDDYFLTGDFTIDLWAYEDANTSTKRWLIDSTASSVEQWGITIDANNLLSANVRRSDNSVFTLTGAVTFDTGEWVHVALERHGNNFNLYHSGSLVDTEVETGNLKTLSYHYLMMGNRYPYNSSGDSNFTGYLDEMRISKTARYSTAAYTPPTAKYADDTGGLFVRLSNGTLVQLGGSVGTSVGDGVWTVRSDNNIYYSLGRVGVGTIEPQTTFEVQETAIDGPAAMLLNQDGAGTGMLLDSESNLHPGIALSMLDIARDNNKVVNPHLLFGYANTFDTNLYRDSANILRTDDVLEVGSNMSGASLTVSSLRSCDTIDTDASGNLTCGTDDGGSQAASDARYVNQSGDTMTGSLTIANNGALNVSGAILTNSNLTINSDNGAANAVLTFGNDAAAETLTFSDSTNRFEFSDDIYTASTITVDGAATLGSTLTIGGVTYTFPASDGSASGKVLKTDSSGQLSWSADTDTNTNAATICAINQYLDGNGDCADVIEEGEMDSIGELETQVGSVNVIVSTEIDAESELEALLSDVSDVYTDNDGDLLTESGLDSRYVEIGGDTMTGALNVQATMSGDNLTVMAGANSYIMGDVGIGTASPATNMEIESTTDAAIYLQADSDNTGGEGDNPYIAFNQDGGSSLTSAGYLGMAGSAGTGPTGQALTNGLSDALVLDTGSTNSLQLGANDTVAITVSNGGNVGLGTNSPSTKLEVVGTASGDTLYFGKQLIGSGTVNIHSAVDTTTAFQIFDADGGSPVFNVDTTNERVGIGTASPGTTLDVAGSITTDSGGYGTLRGGTTSLIIDAGSGYGAMEFKKNNNEIIFNQNSQNYNTHIYSNVGQTFLIQGTTGHAMLALDNAKFLLGAGQDASIYYDGTNMVIDPKEVGSGNLEVVGTASGVKVHAQDLLTSSGNVLAAGNVTINSDNGAANAVLTFGNDAAAETITFNDSTNRFEFSDDLYTANTLTVDGAVTLGSTLTVGGVTYTFPGADGSNTQTLTTNGAGTLSWSTAGGGISQADADSRYVNTSGDTMTGALTVNADVTIGSADTDTLTVTADIGSNLVPNTTNTYDLGTSAKRWNDLYLSGGTLHLGQDGDSARIGYHVADDRIMFDPDGDEVAEMRMSDIGSFDLQQISQDPATSTGYVRLFARQGTGSGNDTNTTFLVQSEDTSGYATNTGIGETNDTAISGSCRSNSTAQKKFGSNSNLYNCSGYQFYRNYSSSDTDVDFTAGGNFTVDMWVYEAANTGNLRWLTAFTQYNNYQWGLTLNTSNQLEARWKTSTGAIFTINDSSTFPTSQWVHIALERNGSTFTLYKNGTSVATETNGANMLNLTSSRYIMAGNRYPYNTSGDENFTGYLDEIRVSNKARYMSNFSVRTAAYSDDDSGLYYRDSAGNITQVVSGGGGGTGGGGGSSLWALNDDSSIHYSFGNVGVGSSAPEEKLEVVGTMSGEKLYISGTGSSPTLITDSGKVGIGTTNPMNLLDVEGGDLAIQNGEDLRWRNTTNVSRASISADTSDNLTFRTGSSDAERMRIDSNGNVGISDTTPSSTLEVRGTVSGSSLHAHSLLTSSGNVLTAGDITINSDNGAADAILNFGNDAAAETLRFNDTTNGFVFSDDVEVQGTLSGANLTVMAGADSYVMGNVGVGLTNPLSKLHISDNNNPEIRVSDADNSVSVQMRAMGAGYGQVYTVSAHDLYLGTANQTSAVVIDDTVGNVGIGTATPVSGNRLSMKETASINAAVAYIDTDNTVLGNTGIARNTDEFFTGTAQNDYVAESIFGDIVLGTNNAERVRIDSTGKVGIGTTSPSEKLEVVGTASGDTLYFGKQLIGSGTVNIHSAVDSTTAFQIFDADGGAPVFNVDTTNERVGIGTASPTEELEVTGDIFATSSINVGVNAAGSSPLYVRKDQNASTAGYIVNNTADTSASAQLVTSANDAGGFVGAFGSSYAAVGTYTDNFVLGLNSDATSLVLGAVGANQYISMFTGGSDAGNERVRIESSGNVGIGTTSPSEKLEVVGTASGDTLYFGKQLIGSGTVNIHSAVDSTTAFQIFDADGGDPVFNVDTTSERIGIGTASAAANLHIKGSAVSQLIEDTGTSIAYTSYTNTDGELRIGKERSAGAGLITGSTGYAGVLATTTADPLQLGTNNSIDMTIDSTGQVGIGSASPTTELEVIGTMSGTALTVGSLKSCNTIDTDANGVMSCGTDEGGAGGGDTYVDYYVHTAGDTMTGALNVQATMSGDNLTVMAGADSYIMGNVGIGTTSPAVPLEVHLDGSPLFRLDRTTVAAGEFDFGISSQMTNTVAGDLLIDGTTANQGFLFRPRNNANAIVTGLGIDRDGNVGIGTTTPTTKLEVVGTMSGKSLSINTDQANETGAIVLDQNGNGTGMLIDSEATNAPGLAIDMQVMSGAALNAPAISFGYRGAFDTSLYRSAANTLTPSGHFIPSAHNTYDLGSLGKRWRDVFSGAGSIHIGEEGNEARIGFNLTNSDLEFDSDGDHTAEVIIDIQGRMGIGAKPSSDMLEVEGSASKSNPGGWKGRSDIRIKKDVETLENSLDVVNALRPIEYRFKPEYLAEHPTIDDHTYYNFIAQEFRDVFPESVYEDAAGYLQIDTYAVRPYLVGAIQELSARVEALEDRMVSAEGAGSVLTISGGTISITSGYHLIEMEEGEKKDVLAHIGGGVLGQVLVLQPNGKQKITLRMSSHLLLEEDFKMHGAGDIIVLLKIDDYRWVELTRTKSDDSRLVDIFSGWEEGEFGKLDDEE